MLVLLIFCTINLTCSRRSDISREYGAKRRGEKKAKQNKTNKKRKKEKKRREKRNSPTSTPAVFFPTHFFSRQPRYLGAWNRLLKITLQFSATVPVPLVTLSFWTTERIVFYACLTPEKVLPIWKKNL